jgi:hypothetical protein
VIATVSVAARRIDRDFQSFPAFGANRMRLPFELLGDKPVKQHVILQPAAIVLLLPPAVP